MPKKLSPSTKTPTLVKERLRTWGLSIHTQRLYQRITAADLCQRISISEATLRRLEAGDPGANVGAYLSALLALGIADEAVPALPSTLWTTPTGPMTKQRVRIRNEERANDADDYF